MPHAIRLQGLKKSFRTPLARIQKNVLHGLDLEIEQGRVFGFLGPNGVGKTTTIKILVGLAFPTEGTAEVLGHPAGSEKAMEQLGFLPENPYFYEYLTPAEALDFYASLFDLDASEKRKRVEDLLAEFDLQQVRNQRVRTFSKGMRQRLGMAQALVGNPKLVILDEPQSGLDPIGRYRIKESILRLKERGVTVFFSSHVLSDVEDLCDDIGLLLNGRLVQSGPLRQLLEAQNQKFELQCKGISPEQSVLLAEQGIKSSFRGEILVLQTSVQDDVGPILDQVRQIGGQVVSLQPIRESLEDYFVRMAQASQPAFLSKEDD